jgi:hypothetical protein
MWREESCRGCSVHWGRGCRWRHEFWRGCSANLGRGRRKCDRQQQRRPATCATRIVLAPQQRSQGDGAAGSCRGSACLRTAAYGYGSLCRLRLSSALRDRIPENGHSFYR